MIHAYELTVGRGKDGVLAYSPEFNPDERVRKNVKHDQIKRVVPMGDGHLWAIALKNNPGIVRGFFGDPHLGYIHQSAPEPSWKLRLISVARQEQRNN
jgi:hypothetical protein